MKKLIFIAILIVGGSVFFPQNTFGQSMMNAENTANETVGEDRIHTESVEIVLQELLSKQKIDTIQKLDCEKIIDEDLERLGDAIMEQQHPGEAHEVMDQMMGGEGSESLQRMHIAMGSNYLGCAENSEFGMMGGGMMSMMMGGGGKSMMGNFGSNSMSTFGWGFGWIFMILFWGLIILGIVTVVKWIADQNKTHMQERSALDILKERYVKGEIDRKEFEEKKKDIK